MEKSKIKENENASYTVCKICGDAYMCMITISMKHIGKDNLLNPNIALCQECLHQIKMNTEDIHFKED
jgi:hypothetical protein